MKRQDRVNELLRSGPIVTSELLPDLCRPGEQMRDLRGATTPPDLPDPVGPNPAQPSTPTATGDARVELLQQLKNDLNPEQK